MTPIQKLKNYLKKIWNDWILSESAIPRMWRNYSFNIQHNSGWKVIHTGLQFCIALFIFQMVRINYKGVISSIWFQKLVQFLSIWSVEQWILSLISLIALYWWIGAWYNKKLAREGGWISWKVRVYMIVIDLTINLGLGIYYMDARETLMGIILLRCPIAISPLIFICEFLIFIWYYRKYHLKKK